jgi:multidrug efflux pump
MFSRFFVRRPVFAWVIAILIMLAGMLAIRTLPVAQYPDVAPPSIKISATYTGASAQTLENSVTQVIEQQLTGLDNLLYFSSTSSSDGSVSINVTFEQGTDPDTAQFALRLSSILPARLVVRLSSPGLKSTWCWQNAGSMTSALAKSICV